MIISFLVVIPALVLVGVGIYLISFSKYSNCAVAAEAENFTGRYLKNSGNTVLTVIDEVECIKMDKIMDKGDGPKQGKVRWVSCFNKENCQNAGLQ